MRLLPGVTLTVALAVAGCGGAAPVASLGPTTAADAASRSGAPDTWPPSSNSAWVTTGEGVSLTVEVDRLAVAPGGTVTFSTAFTNHRDEPVTYAVASCGHATQLAVVLAIPTEPEGRAWPGIAGEFKQYALTEGHGPGGVSANAPLRTEVIAAPCAQPVATEAELPPGDSITSVVRWPAELVDGVAALPGPVPFEARVAYDPANGPPGQAQGLLFGQYKEVRVDGELTVAGRAAEVASAGEAVDAVLNDVHFVHWLSTQPRETWSGANLYLQSLPTAQGIVPAGPTWSVELFREVGVPRHWAIAHVGAVSAELRGIHYCDIPCHR